MGKKHASPYGSVAERIAFAREFAGQQLGEGDLTQEAFGLLCGWEGGQGRIGNYENGSRTPSLTDFIVIAKAFQLPAEWLAFGSNYKLKTVTRIQDPKVADRLNAHEYLADRITTGGSPVAPEALRLAITWTSLPRDVRTAFHELIDAYAAQHKQKPKSRPAENGGGDEQKDDSRRGNRAPL